MVHYKLEYFDGRGLAETIRQLFVLAGQEYEDVRYTREQVTALKEKVPFGQFPVLEVDGKQLAQSLAITRYLAKKFGFAGKSEWDSAVVDSLGDQFKDFMSEIRSYNIVALGFAEGDKEALTKDVFLPGVKKMLTQFTVFLKNAGKGYLVGDSLTWIDLTVAEYCAQLAENHPEVLNEYPALASHKDKIHANPKISKWRAARPASIF